MTDNERDEEQEMHQDNIITQEIRSITEHLKSPDIEERLIGIERARKHLVEEDSPLFESYYEEGVIPPLVMCLGSPDVNLQLEAASALTNIVSEKSKYANSIYEADGIPLLIHLLGSSDEAVATQAVAAIGSLSEKSIFICGKVIELGAVKPLHRLVQITESTESLRTLSKTIKTITSHKSLSPPQEDIEALVSSAKLFLHHPDEEIYTNGCWSFADITENDRHKIDVVLEGKVIHHLIDDFLNSDDNKRVIPAVKAIGNILAETDEQTEAVVAAGVIPVLVKQLDHSMLKVRKDCAWALSNITGGTRSQIQKAIDSDVLSRLAKVINEDEDPVRKEAIWCVSNLTEIGSPSQIKDALRNNLLPSFAGNIKRYTVNYDKSLLYHILNGMRNMIKYCDDEAAVGDILEKVSMEDIVKLTVWDDSDISELAKLLYFFLSYDEDEEEEKEDDYNLHEDQFKIEEEDEENVEEGGLLTEVETEQKENESQDDDNISEIFRE